MAITIEKHYLQGNGRVPNSRLPLLIYRNVMRGVARDLETVMRSNHWLPTWHAHVGMWPHHHFHAEAHEIIAVTAGEHEGKFGGHDGIRTTLCTGDVVVIPAGVGHMGGGYTEGLNLTGGFPSANGIIDFRYGLPEEYEECARRSALVPVGSFDPFFGLEGPLVRIWRDADRGIRDDAHETFNDALLSQHAGATAA